MGPLNDVSPHFEAVLDNFLDNWGVSLNSAVEGGVKGSTFLAHPLNSFLFEDTIEGLVAEFDAGLQVALEFVLFQEVLVLLAEAGEVGEEEDLHLLLLLLLQPGWGGGYLLAASTLRSPSCCAACI